MEFPLLGYGKPGIFHAENAVFADSTPSRSTSACATARLAPSSPCGVGTDSIFVPHTPACATLADLPTGGRSDSRGAEQTAADKKTAQRKRLNQEALALLLTF